MMVFSRGGNTSGLFGLHDEAPVESLGAPHPSSMRVGEALRVGTTAQQDTASTKLPAGLTHKVILHAQKYRSNG